MCNVLNIKHKRTTSYRPQTNGRLERMHTEIKKHLRVIAASYGLNFSYNLKGKQVDNWDEFLNIIKFKLNCTPSKITNCAPIELILGFIPTMPEDRVWNIDNKGQLKLRTHQDYIKWINGIKQVIRDNAVKSQSTYDAKRKAKYDKGVTPSPQYKIGDLVRYYRYDTNKMCPRWSNKFTITKFYDDFVVEIKEVGNPTNVRTVNIDHIKLSTPLHIPDLEPLIGDNELIFKKSHNNNN